MGREFAGDDTPDDQGRRASSGGLGALYDRHADRLRRLVAFRIDGRLRGRLDASDVIQEAFLDASERFESYRLAPPMPEFLWLRFLALQRLARAHRHHLGVRARDATLEVGTAGTEGVDALVDGLIDQLTTPSQAAIRDEQCRRLRSALEALDPIDREVITLRHFEQLSNAEAARVLGLRDSAASNRYIRALQRLRAALPADPSTPSGPGS